MLRILTDRELKPSGKSTFSNFLARNSKLNKLFSEVTITTKDDTDIQEFEHKLEMLCYTRIYDMLLVKEKAGQVHYHGIMSYPRLTLIDEVNNERLEGKLMHDFLKSILMLVPIPKDRLENTKKRYARKSNMKNTKIPRWGTVARWIDYCTKGLPTTDTQMVNIESVEELEDGAALARGGLGLTVPGDNISYK